MKESFFLFLVTFRGLKSFYYICSMEVFLKVLFSAFMLIAVVAVAVILIVVTDSDDGSNEKN